MTDLHTGLYRPWEDLKDDEQEEIRADPEHKGEDYARYRWKRSCSGGSWVWDKLPREDQT